MGGEDWTAVRRTARWRRIGCGLGGLEVTKEGCKGLRGVAKA